MKAFESNNRNGVEVDGIRFETVVPERVLSVPVSPSTTYTPRTPYSHTPVHFGIRITNNSSTPLQFLFYRSFCPELLTPEGQIKQAVYGSDQLLGISESDFLLASPGESVTFLPYVVLSAWSKRKHSSWSKPKHLAIAVPAGDGGYLSFGQLKPGTYQIRFRYEITRERVERLHHWIEPKILEEVWTGQVLTPFVEFCLVSSE